MEEKIIRPTTKPEAIKGKLLKYQGTDYCEFLPQSQGEPQYEGISKTRNSQLKRSKGKNPKLVAHLTAKADSMDPDKENATPKPRGRRLMAESEIEVRLNSEQRQVECQFYIPLAGNVRYTESLFTIFSKINSCLAFNQDSLKPLVHAPATSSMK